MVLEYFLLSYSGAINVKCTSIQKESSLSLGFGVDMDIDTSKFESYQCDGSLIAEQLIDLGSFDIPRYEMVKSVVIELNIVKVDDQAVVKINDDLKVVAAKMSEVSSGPKYYKEEHPVTLTQNPVHIYVGAENLKITKCNIDANNLKIIFKY